MSVWFVMTWFIPGSPRHQRRRHAHSSAHQTNTGRLITLQFTLPPDELMEVAAQVVRDLPEQGGLIPTAVEFIDLDERERDNIIKFVFARQRSLRRKGLL